MNQPYAMKKRAAAAFGVGVLLAPGVYAGFLGKTAPSRAQVTSSPATPPPQSDAGDLPSNAAESGVVIATDHPTRFSCGGKRGVRFGLLGPLLAKDDQVRIIIREYEWDFTAPTDRTFASPGARRADPSPPANTLTHFERGKAYEVTTSEATVFQCGLYLEKRVGSEMTPLLQR